ncbi:MAG: DUF2996 domain-containing protein [Kaiparowitsia implicata GSE-PSE-MK54-09C]|jgi:hypothetical protein|nr:DUF2996 domain-containing protein [Kaiparowitsia implicata GSE-PSE-MK54-09C]
MPEEKKPQDPQAEAAETPKAEANLATSVDAAGESADKAASKEAAGDANPKPAAKAKPAGAKPAGAKPAGAKPAAKKEKPPALEDKPFEEFIREHYMPALTKTLETLGVSDLTLAFEKQPFPVRGVDQTPCWQVKGAFQAGQRQFWVGFLKDDISGQKVFAQADFGAHPSLLESFMIDERRVNLDLMVMYVVQRLNGQKWLARN